MILFVGGVRSGKSALAEAWAGRLAPSGLYVATGLPCDPEMARRIAAHRERRGPFWQTLEASLEPEAAIRGFLADNPGFPGSILFDCLSGWLANLLLAPGQSGEIERRCGHLLDFFATLPNPVLLVSLECGCGIIPDNPLARGFGDLLGLVNQMAASFCQSVALVSCGLPVWLKGAPSGKEHKFGQISVLRKGAPARGAAFAALRQRGGGSRRLHRGNRHRG